MIHIIVILCRNFIEVWVYLLISMLSILSPFLWDTTLSLQRIMCITVPHLRDQKWARLAHQIMKYRWELCLIQD